jgi:ELWxxDGT repeat protein
MLKKVMSFFVAFIAVFALSAPISHAVEVPYLVKDINSYGTMSSDAVILGPVGDDVYFTLTDSTYGRELWKSDGTEVGTVMVKDINPGSSGSSISSLFALNGIAYFIADNGTGGYNPELWRTDGTDTGTYMVKDIDQSGFSMPSIFSTVSLGYSFFFSANNGTDGTELWKSDGTEGGTVMVKDIYSGSNGSSPSSFSTSTDGYVYFFAEDATSGRELWRTDGTEGGTTLVKDIRLGALSSNGSGTLGVPGYVYFTADNGTNGTELWKSDGTATGTVMVRDIRSGATGSSIQSIFALESSVYFSATNGTNGSELWRSDGTATGTVMVRDIRSGAASGFINSRPKAFNGKFYFSANDGTNGAELWESDGTATGTVMVKNIAPGAGNANPFLFDVLGSNLYFMASDAVNGYELWKSDGTATGTVMAKDLTPGSAGSTYSSGGSVSGSTHFFFVANAGSKGAELWVSDGTEQGTVIVKDLNTLSDSSKNINPSSGPGHHVTFGRFSYFSATDGISGYELWRTDGTASGTTMVKDIYPGPNDSAPSEMYVADDKLYFSAADAYGRELWVTDGTEGGTRRLVDINVTGTFSSNPYGMTLFNDVVYFSAKTSDTNNGNFELWRTDGTEEGTYLLKEIMAGFSGSSIVFSAVTDEALYFSASDGTNGSELWRTDGTEEGTVLVKDIRSGSNSSTPNYFKAIGSLVYFSATDGTNGTELWRTDGTATGTVMVKDIYPGSSSSNPTNLLVFGENLYFFATDSANGNELWKSDGTEGGTVLVKDAYAGPSSGVPDNAQGLFLESSDSLMFFLGTDGTNGNELWKSDGTTVGTIPVFEDLNPAANSYIGSPKAINEKLYFTTGDFYDTTGFEPWVSDGTEVGTRMIYDIYEGTYLDEFEEGEYPNNSSPIFFTGVRNKVIFFATTREYGLEPWALQIASSTAPVLGDVSVSVSGLTALASSTVSDEGTGNVVSRGFDYGVGSFDAQALSGGGLGSFSFNITGLSCASTYTLRPFASSTDYLAYGSTTSFSTAACPVAGRRSSSRSGGGGGGTGVVRTTTPVISTTSSAPAPSTGRYVIGSTGPDVELLQRTLISLGYSIPAGVTGYFGEQTRAAFAALQASGGLMPSAATNMVVPSVVSPNRNLALGSSGAPVSALQNALIGLGFSVPAGATGFFGEQTRAALVAFQTARGITPAVGFFGSLTRQAIEAAGYVIP